MRRSFLIVLVVLTAAGVGYAVAQSGKTEGRISPKSGLQVSGRQLAPFGRMTELGNYPAGGALTTNGRFLWTLSAGRGRNDIRIVEVEPKGRCRRDRRGRRCRRKLQKRVGRVVQNIEMPGLSGGIAMAADGRTAYVSGTPESSNDEQKVAKGVPGKDGDVVHVFRYNGTRGTATRAGTIPVPPPGDAPLPQAFPLTGLEAPGTPPPQSFPPTETSARAWPRELAISPDGRTLLAALNLADNAAVVDIKTKKVRYVETGNYPYGAAITPDGKRGFVSSETDATVTVINLKSAKKVKDIQVGPHLSHPQAIAMDRSGRRAFVAVAHQDLVAVIDTRKLVVERTLSVERPQGIGTQPVDLSVSSDGCDLLVADSGEDAIAVFALPREDGRTCPERVARKAKKKKRKSAKRRTRGDERRAPAFTGSADRVLQHEGRKGAEYAENEDEEKAEIYGEAAEEKAERAKVKKPVRKRPKAFSLTGRIPVGSYPVEAHATPKRKKVVWIAAEGLGTGPNTYRAGEKRAKNDPGSSVGNAPAAYQFKYLPRIVFGRSGIGKYPTAAGFKKLTPKASRQIRPVNGQKPPAGTPIRAPGSGQKIEHVFYVVRENRTYDQILGDDTRGDGDPKLTLFGQSVTPNAHALAKRFPLLDHVYANSEASIDGHFWTSAAAVSDYVSKNWHQNYGGRGRPYDFGVYAVTWPSQRFLFDQAEKQGISWFNYGEAIAGTVPLADKDRRPQETAEVARKTAKSDLGPPVGCFSNDASSGGVDVVASAGPGPDLEVYDSSRPAGAPLNSVSRFDCFRTRFLTQVATSSVPAFNYLTFSNDHTAGTTPGQRTPRAMIAENDYALGQLVDLISKSSIWDKSLILVIEDDSQDGADHVDAHRIPAFAISPYAKRGAVVHTRYDFLSFIRTLEIVVGMKPLNLFDALAVPMYDAFGPNPDNDEPYNAIKPSINLTERNSASSTNARFSKSLPLLHTDRSPQRYLDKILWQYVHGKDSEPPPPGPNASGLDEEAWKRTGQVADPEELLEKEAEEEE